MSRLVISALSGGSGKTFMALGLARSFKNLGLAVKTFKKGPDYIDSALLGLASGNYCTNLDPFFLEDNELLELYHSSLARLDSQNKIAVIEGNRGLFDGRDLFGSCSTAKLAKLLQAPVILTLNCSKMTRTVAALVAGVQAFDPNVNLAGVILNNIGSKRHAQQVQQAIEYYTQVPVLGIMPRISPNPINERHMGLAFVEGEPELELSLQTIANYVQTNCNLEQIIQIAQSSKELDYPKIETKLGSKKYKLGVIKDKCLWFYYQENIQALELAGAEIIYLSLFDPIWDKIEDLKLDGLYLGGGFPEVYASELEKASLHKIKELAEQGLAIYAECGGFMLLCKNLQIESQSYKMSNVFNLTTVFHHKPQGLGYVEAEVISDNPYFAQGTKIKGHEFHYSKLQEPLNQPYQLKLSLGQGMGEKKDGLLYKNCFASYTHIFAPNLPDWADNFVKTMAKYHELKAKN